MPFLVDYRHGEVGRLGISVFGEFVDYGSSRVSQIIKLGNLVKGFSRSIVDCGT